MGVGKHPELTPDDEVTALLLLPAPEPENSGTEGGRVAVGPVTKKGRYDYDHMHCWASDASITVL